MSLGEGRIIEVNKVSLHVEDYGNGTPVLLLHGWPDSAYVWRNQIPFLTGQGFRAIAPDLRGFGRSSRPVEVTDYPLSNPVGDVTGLLDALGVESAHVVGHDWEAAVAWRMAMSHAHRVQKLVVVSVGHPSVPWSLRQDEMAWYELLPIRRYCGGHPFLRRLGLAAAGSFVAPATRNGTSKIYHAQAHSQPRSTGIERT